MPFVQDGVPVGGELEPFTNFFRASTSLTKPVRVRRTVSLACPALPSPVTALALASRALAVRLPDLERLFTGIVLDPSDGPGLLWLTAGPEMLFLMGRDCQTATTATMEAAAGTGLGRGS